MAATNRSAPFERSAEHGNATRPEPDSIVCRLAKEMQVPVGVVAEIYEYEVADLNTNARVTAYISVLALKRVRETLRQRGESRGNVTQFDRHSPKESTASPPCKAASATQAIFPGYLSLGVGLMVQFL